MRWVALLLLAAAPALEAQAVRNNAGFKSRAFARNDDLSTGLQDIGFVINFFGSRRAMAYVNNNGNITFDAPLATFTPFGLTGTQREIIAAFFADVDTRGPRSALVTYGQDTVNGRRAFGVNYVDVGYFASHDDRLNSFQLILIERADTGEANFDIEFNYDRIVWETGDASGGANGFGGTPAAVGWSNGTGLPGTSFELTGSLISGSFLDSGPRSLVRNRLNGTQQRGRYVFRARNGSILPPLTITNGPALPNATLSLPYSLQLSSVGGMAPFRWSMQADPGTTLPGFSLSADGVFSGTPSSTGTYFFTVTHTARNDDGDETVTKRLSVTVDPPVLRVTSACPLRPGTAGTPYFAEFQAAGSAGPVVWSMAEGSVPGLTLNASGQLSGVPSAAGNYILTVRVASSGSDGAAPASRSCGLTIHAPVYELTSSCALPPATMGVPYSQHFAVSGGRGPYRWTISGGLPPGLSLQADGGILGTPNVVGTYPFAIAVTDGRGETSAETCSLTVNSPVVRLATACPLPAGTTGVPYSKRLAAEGGAGPYKWSVLGSLPGGIELSPDGTLQGVPYQAGPFLFRLLISDSEGSTGAYACGTSVARSAISLNSCPMPNARVGQPYSRMLAVSGGTTPYSFAAQGPLPEGLSLTPNGQLRGTPLRPGLFPLAVVITDGAGRSGQQSCALTVDAPALRIATACPLPPAKLGTPYSQPLEVAGGLRPIRFSAIGRLPGGLTLNEDGRLEGSAIEKGVFPFTVRAADAAGQAATSDCSLSVVFPELPDIRVIDVSSAFDTAVTGPSVGVELSRPYSLPVEGVLNLGAAADTGTFDIDVDRPDPRLRFANAQRSVRFSIPPGSQSVRFPLNTTGTVASVVTMSVTNLQILGNSVVIAPAAKQFKVNRTVPVVSSACYTPTPNGMELALSGYTPTRELTKAAISFSRAAAQNKTVNVAQAALEWFVTDEAVRNGGAFTLRLPLEVLGNAAELGDVAVSLANTQGTAANRTAARCQ
jgi:hypothetical protein